MSDTKGFIIDKLERTERPGMGRLIDHLEAIGFFTSPASTSYHMAKDEGLVEHSWQVYAFGSIYLPVLFADNDISSDSWVIVSLLHDVGKATYREKPHYVENILKSGNRSESKRFETNPERTPIPHEILSLQIIGQFIQLTEAEEVAILYHNGQYTALGRELNGKEQPLQQILHFADMYCSRFLEVR